MKITKRQLRKIIKEEIQKELRQEGIMDSIKGMFGGGEKDPNEGVDPRLIKWIKDSDLYTDSDVPGRNKLKVSKDSSEMEKGLRELEYLLDLSNLRGSRTQTVGSGLKAGLELALEDADGEFMFGTPEEDSYDLRGMQFDGPCAQLTGRELEKCMEREDKKNQHRFDREHAGQDEDDGYRVHNTGAGYSAKWAE